MDRKKFISQLAIGGLAGITALQACATDGEKQITRLNKHEKTIHWRMVTTWPPKFPYLGQACDLFAEWVNVMSDGRLQI